MDNIADNFPRRARIDKMTPAELAIRNASLAVEEAGAHPLLTEAVTLLQDARERVADFVDKVERPIVYLRVNCGACGSTFHGTGPLTQFDCLCCGARIVTEARPQPVLKPVPR